MASVDMVCYVAVVLLEFGQLVEEEQLQGNVAPNFIKFDIVSILSGHKFSRELEDGVDNSAAWR